MEPTIIINRHGVFRTDGDGLVSRIGEVNLKEEQEKLMETINQDRAFYAIAWLGIGIVAGLMISGLLLMVS